MRNAKLFSFIGIAVMVGLALSCLPRSAEWDWNSVIRTFYTGALDRVYGGLLPNTAPATDLFSCRDNRRLLNRCNLVQDLASNGISLGVAAGPTNDDIAISIDRYASQNISLQLADHFLGNAPETEKCGDSGTYCGNTRTYAMLKPLPKSGWSIRLFPQPGIGQMFSFLLLTLCGLII